MSPTGVNTDGWRLIKQNDNRFWFCFGGGGGNGCGPSAPTTVFSTTSATTGSWFHVAAVKTATELAIYVNGVKEGAKPSPTFTDTNSANLLIGANALEGAHLNGLIDEAEIFNRALSASEIQAIVHADTAGKCKATPTPTPTATATFTPTPTATATFTPTATATATATATRLKAPLLRHLRLHLRQRRHQSRARHRLLHRRLLLRRPQHLHQPRLTARRFSNQSMPMGQVSLLLGVVSFR